MVRAASRRSNGGADGDSRAVAATRTRRTGSQPSPRRRMTKAARREQLLDVAGVLVAEEGLDALTMERVAERAGVSKALPYTHFANADDLAVAVYRREIADHRRRVRDGLSKPGHEASRAGFRAFFETVKARQMLFSRLMTPTHAPGTLHDQQLAYQDENEHYYAHRYRERLGVTDDTALIAACIMLASLQGTVRAWRKGYGTEQEIEDAFSTMIDGGLRALRDAERAPATGRRARTSSGV